MMNWSATSGANLVAHFERNALLPERDRKEMKYRAKARGFDRRGDQRWNEMTLVALVPEKSNAGFTTVIATAIGIPKVELRIHHNSRYLTPANYVAPVAAAA